MDKDDAPAAQSSRKEDKKQMIAGGGVTHTLYHAPSSLSRGRSAEDSTNQQRIPIPGLLVSTINAHDPRNLSRSLLTKAYTPRETIDLTNVDSMDAETGDQDDNNEHPMESNKEEGKADQGSQSTIADTVAIAEVGGGSSEKEGNTEKTISARSEEEPTSSEEGVKAVFDLRNTGSGDNADNAATQFYDTVEDVAEARSGREAADGAQTAEHAETLRDEQTKDDAGRMQGSAEGAVGSDIFYDAWSQLKGLAPFVEDTACTKNQQPELQVALALLGQDDGSPKHEGAHSASRQAPLPHGDA
ncbi:hypothetical protein ANO11243_023760 [Dothideomycetidae sp. 11243]|nr:hypothetical protein ANO11243_023760 [fungal sp. No.11243]